jgi:anti-anti-sigma factor
MTDGTMTISLDRSDGVEIIRLEGDVDLTNADLVREAVDATTADRIVLDLSAVTFLDSMAISTLDGGHRRLASEDRSLVVVSPPETPSAWTLRVTGLAGDVCESLDEALVAVAVRYAGRPAG